MRLLDFKNDEPELKRMALSFDLKADGDGGKFTGYGAVFGNVDHGGDLIRQGAFADTIQAWKSKGKWPKLLWQHDTHKPIGVWTDMREDDHGLLVEGKFTKGVQQADEAYALLKDGALDGLSIGYRTVEAEYDNDLGIRSLEKLDLHEVSIVTVPMNEAAGVSAVKSLTEAIDELHTLSDAERLLREVDRPFSRKEATGFMSVIKKIAQREAGDDRCAFDEVGALAELAQRFRAA